MKFTQLPKNNANEITLTSKKISKNFDVEALYHSTIGLPQHLSPFLDENWQSSWIKALETPISLVEFWLKKERIGFAFIGITKAFRFFPFKKALLNQSGIQQQDQVWIECNDIICDEAHKSTCTTLLLKYIFKQPFLFRCEASFLSSTTHWLNAAAHLGLNYERQNIPSYMHTFSERSLESAFSSNTRSQIRRAVKKANAELGEISVSAASTTALSDYFQQLGALHIEQWANTPEGSGFQNPQFILHHETLFTLAPERVRLLKVSAGTELIGFSYYLIHNKVAYFYCAGINYSIVHKAIKPGYLLHYLAMRFFAEEGFTGYDFLGGDYRYKKSLSNHSYNFSTLTFFSPRLLPRAIEKLNNLLKTCRRFIAKPNQIANE